MKSERENKRIDGRHSVPGAADTQFPGRGLWRRQRPGGAGGPQLLFEMPETRVFVWGAEGQRALYRGGGAWSGARDSRPGFGFPCENAVLGEQGGDRQVERCNVG